MTSNFWVGRQIHQNWTTHDKIGVYTIFKSDRGKWEGQKEAKKSGVNYGWPLYCRVFENEINLSCELIIEDQNCEKKIGYVEGVP